MIKIKKLQDIDVNNKKVILRAELDVPLENGKVLSDIRLKANIPTINYLLENNAKQIIIIGHLGRPKNKEQEKSLKHIHKPLEELTNQEIAFIPDFNITDLPENKLILFENTRFFAEEINNNPDFAKKIASFGDIFVNNCFSTLTRDHASITGIAKFLPAVAGLKVIEELEALNISNKQHPKALILGGAKMETKIPVIKSMFDKVDKIFLGSATIILLLKVLGKYNGKILYDYHNVEELKEIANNPKIIVPVDFICSKTKTPSDMTCKTISEIQEDDYVCDFGPITTELFKRELSAMKTIIWNGPLGYYEVPEFAKSSIELADFISKLDCFTLIGGGDTEEVLKIANIENKINHVCIGGGSMLKFLANQILPGLEVLKK